jgi:hypothetical protein
MSRESATARLSSGEVSGLLKKLVVCGVLRNKPPCVESPTLSGSVTPDGALTATLSSTLSSSVGSLQGCTLSVARPLTGQIGSQIVDRGLLHLFSMIDWTCGVNQVREGIDLELGPGFL